MSRNPSPTITLPKKKGVFWPISESRRRSQVGFRDMEIILAGLSLQWIKGFFQRDRTYHLGDRELEFLVYNFRFLANNPRSLQVELSPYR
ncbi:hypothetical protein PGT21_031109 [Puccinia graminis f. sp. tritici]|uniref:Uncharacterized protein n=1 Tax=Puccinia graminis f. sp. tritici TaxID=56615 RepID=A0A5B0N7A1_PUCGR|nr:hypothetical protein PGT21_031109 [Puccinia graminis f. sp. tritici]